MGTLHTYINDISLNSSWN